MCWFYARNGRCSRGDNCHFLHGKNRVMGCGLLYLQASLHLYTQMLTLSGIKGEVSVKKPQYTLHFMPSHREKVQRQITEVKQVITIDAYN